MRRLVSRSGHRALTAGAAWGSATGAYLQHNPFFGIASAASRRSSSGGEAAAAASSGTADSTAAAAAASSSNSSSSSSSKVRHPRLLSMCSRELVEEGIRDERPEEPQIPRGWKIVHEPCSAILDLQRTFRPFGQTAEELHEIRCSLETKHPEKTFKPDLGERVDPQHLTFHLFISKPGSAAPGGVEFMLTTVDGEIVLDAMAVHNTAEDLANAKRGMFDGAHRGLRDGKYRGPSINELDDEFLDEILDYLDERSINNAFGEFMLAQVNFVEQLEYETFITALQQFAR